MPADEYISIRREDCIACGMCIQVCPFRNFELVEGRIIYNAENCIACGHCAAACPQGAIRVPEVDRAESDFANFVFDKTWLPHGQFDTAGLVRLMASRRSCRNFDGRTIDRSILEDLVKIGVTAPSGTNSQLWTFTVLPTGKAVLSFADHIASFFKKLNAMAERSLLRIALKLSGKGELDDYYKKYYPLVKKTLEEWEASRKDRLFHGATAVIAVGSKPGASCPAEDAMLATQNILLGAHSMGLGSCLIGFAVSAMKESPEIKKFIGIPADETIYSVIALGYPKESYTTVAGRKKPVTRYFEG
jgi:nitroreductase/NAD-dependent dihydropyrimidine dehydrogenase PreA subunit